MFKVGDYVKVIKGLHNGSEGTVVKISKNDMGTITYEIHVEKLYKRIGNISKREGEIKMAKRGRPVKNTSKIEQLKEVTKQVVEMTEAEPTAVVDEPVDKAVEVVDKAVEVVDKAVEVVDEAVEVVDEAVEAVDKAVEEPKRAYDQLMEVYDELCKKLTFVELSSFYDIVAKDVEASKYVLEQMYQMSIEQLAKIRKGLA